MRKSVITFALAMFAAASLPAQAARFNCILAAAGNPVQSCPIDTANPNLRCRYTYNPTLHAVCLAAGDQVACFFSADGIYAAEGLASVQTKPFAPAPGFLAGVIAEASTKHLLLGYIENRAAPQVDALCTAAP